MERDTSARNAKRRQKFVIINNCVEVKIKYTRDFIIIVGHIAKATSLTLNNGRKLDLIATLTKKRLLNQISFFSKKKKNSTWIRKKMSNFKKRFTSQGVGRYIWCHLNEQIYIQRYFWMQACIVFVMLFRRFWERLAIMRCASFTPMHIFICSTIAGV